MNTRRGSRPPGGAVALLRLVLPPGTIRDSILEDLAYEHRKLTESGGPEPARRWYRRQAWRVAGRCMLDRLGKRSWSSWPPAQAPRPVRPQGPRFRPLAGLDQTLRDLRHGVRQLRRRPASALVAVISLALGIGANTALFSMVNGLFIRPLQVEAPDELVAVFTSRLGERRYGSTSYPDYLDYKEENPVFSGVAAHTSAPMSLTGEEEPQIVWGQVVSQDYFQVLGVRAALGRTFGPGEGNPEDPRPVVVLSHGTWRGSFGGDPDILGSTIRINDYPFTVIGVAPQGFKGLFSLIEPALWAPISTVYQALPYTPNVPSRFDPWLQLVARRRPGLSLEEAQAGMDVVAANLGGEHPETHRSQEILVEPVASGRLGGPEDALQAKRGLALLLGVVGFVLLIACFNVANLEMAKATGRTREIALRLSMGASRWRIVRQLLAESSLLALLGGGAGVGVGILTLMGIPLIQPPSEVPIPIPATLDYHVLAVTLVLALGTGLLFGLAPALQVLKPHQTEALKEEGPTMSRSRKTGHIQKLLVAGQVALSLVLLTVSGLLMRNLSNTLAIDPGFGLRQGLVVPLSMGYGQYSEEEGRALQQNLLHGIGALPGVESAAMASFLPLGLSHGRHDVRVDGYEPAPGERLLVMRNMVSPNFFNTMEIPVVRGRAIDEEDTEDAPLVAMVNQTMAQRYWPGRDAIGGRVQADLGQVYTVVGVFADGKYDSLTEAPQPYLVLPRAQAEYVANMNLVVKASADPMALIPVLSSELRSQLPGIPPPRTMTVPQYLQYSQGSARGPAFLVGVLGLLALLLASVGLYGIMAHNVSQRTREFGVRLAMGATGPGIKRQVVGGGLKIIVFGLIAGSFMALVASQTLATFLYEVDPLDPLPFLGGAVVLLAAGLLATLLPARRAARADPSISLRAE